MVEHQSIEVQPQGESNVTTWGEVRSRIGALLEGENDWVAAMATVVCELHHTFDHFHWTGFYRTVRPNHLKIGPYQVQPWAPRHPLRSWDARGGGILGPYTGCP